MTEETTKLTPKGRDSARNVPTKVSVVEKTTAASRASGTSLRFADLNPTTTELPLQQQSQRQPEQRSSVGDRESTSMFIEKKREMFLLEYSLSVKREEMERLEQETSKREQALEQTEHEMEEELARYDSMTKDLTLRAMEATKRAEAETKVKLERQTEMKRLTVAIASIKSEIAKLDERLEDCKRYKSFLDGLSPINSSPSSEHQQAQQQQTNSSSGAGAFQDPGQLLSAFKALEKRNLFLINHNQDTERVLEDLKQKRAEVEQRMGVEIAGLKQQIARVEADIVVERDKQKALKRQSESRLLQQQSTTTASTQPKASSNSNASNNATAMEQQQDAMLAELRSKVEEVYTRVVGENSAGMGTLQMVASIERRIDELLAVKARLPVDYVARAEQAKEKERRQRARDEKAEREKEDQQAKIQRAIERSQRPVPVKKGKPVMFRSYLPEKVDKRALEEKRRKEEELADMRYFGIQPPSSDQPPQSQTKEDNANK